MKSMTELAHDFLQPVLRRGAVVIDATLGQGNDSAFFLQHPVSRVFAFDVQEHLVHQASEKLDDRRFFPYCHSHAELMDFEPLEKYKEKVDAAIFNFGYDPVQHGGIMTEPGTSLKAVLDLLVFLRIKGRMALVFYPHEQGQKEKELIMTCLSEFSRELDLLSTVRLNRKAPSLLMIEKRCKIHVKKVSEVYSDYGKKQ